MIKRLSVLVLLLSLMFAPFVFAVDIIQNAPVIQGHSAPILSGYGPEIGNFDYAGDTQNITIIYTPRQSESPAPDIRTALATSEENEAPVIRKEAAVLTDRTVLPRVLV